MRDFPLANSNFLAVALYMATTAMVDWIKVLEVCVSNRTTVLYSVLVIIETCQVSHCPCCTK